MSRPSRDETNNPVVIQTDTNAPKSAQRYAQPQESLSQHGREAAL